LQACFNPSGVPNACGVGLTLINCQAGTCGVTFDPTITIQVDPEGVALAAVKDQLQQELAAVERQQQAVTEALRPQTTAEVEELQTKLRDAIAELEARKQELQKSEKSGKQ
jgi:hypothetical protein